MGNSNKKQLFSECAKINNVKSVAALLGQLQGAEINTVIEKNGASLLHYASKFSDEKMIIFLIECGISANVADYSNETPLLWACQKPDNVENVSVLLNFKADLNKTNSEYGACALHYAAMKSDKRMIEFLINCGISANVQDNDSQTPLLWACKNVNNTENVAVLLQYEADFNRSNKQHGACALHYAAKYSDSRLIKFLIARGISVNVMDNDNKTPLLWACQKANNSENATVLLEQGAYINRINKENGACALHYAAKFSDKNMIEFLIKNDMSVNAMDNDNKTPLLWASENSGNVENVKFLLKHKADINKKNRQNSACALHYAAKFSDKYMIDFLVENGFSANVTDNDNRTPLFWACLKANNFDNLSALLKHGADNNACDISGRYAIHYAAQFSDTGVIEFLIQNGNSVNVMDNDNKTPLLWACQKANNVETVTFLLSHGVNINKFDNLGSSALHYAAKFSDKSVIELLLETGMSVNVTDYDNKTPLLWACEKANNLENVTVLLKHSSDINNISEEYGACALHYAAKYSDKSTIEFLIKNDMSVNVMDNDNKTPLLWASENSGNVENVKFLLKHKADINKKNRQNGACALHYAAKFSDKYMIDFLVENGFSANVTDNDNRTPLFWACLKANNFDNLSALLKHGADNNACDISGRYAIHYAAQFSDTGVIEFLIQNGNSVNVMDNDNKTPLLWACQKANNVETVTFLLSHGADINKFDNLGSSALHYAAKFSDKSVIELLLETGMSVNVTDYDNKTPLLWACEKANNLENVTVLLKHSSDINNISEEYGAWALHYAAKYSDKSTIQYLCEKGICVNVADNKNKTPLLWALENEECLENTISLLELNAQLILQSNNEKDLIKKQINYYCSLVEQKIYQVCSESHQHDCELNEEIVVGLCVINGNDFQLQLERLRNTFASNRDFATYDKLINDLNDICTYLDRSIENNAKILGQLSKEENFHSCQLRKEVLNEIRKLNNTEQLCLTCERYVSFVLSKTAQRELVYLPLLEINR